MEIEMKKKETTNDEIIVSDFPDIQIIDLDNNGSLDDLDGQDPESEGDTRTFPRFINIHTVCIAIILLVIAGIFFSLKNWGTKIKPEDLIALPPGTYEDTLDCILPIMNQDENAVNPADDGITQIVCFGNAPFADDRDISDGLANLIATDANAVVYNCSISGSYLSALNPSFDAETHPEDAYNFYWLTVLGLFKDADSFIPTANEKLGSKAPADAMEVYDRLLQLDFNKIDTVVIMYDASDYLNGNPMYSDDNPTDITTFTGNLSAGIELIQNNFPHIRIIVLSPTYAYGLDKDGNKVSSDIQKYGWDVLSTYVIKESDACSECQVSFVDNLYGTITEDDAPNYLTDHLHLNQDGRKRVAARFIDALTHFDKKDEN